MAHKIAKRLKFLAALLVGFVSLVIPLVATAAPSDWVAHFYGGMEEVLEQVERSIPPGSELEPFEVFIRSDLFVEQYLSAYLSSDLGAPFWGLPWVRTHYWIMIRQWRGLLPHLPRDFKRRLWALRPASAGVPVGPPGSNWTPTGQRRRWIENGAAQWDQLRELLFSTVTAIPAHPEPDNTLGDATRAGILLMRRHQSIENQVRLRTVALEVLRPLFTNHAVVLELKKMGEPHELEATLNQVEHQWLQALEAKFQEATEGVYQPVELRSLAAATLTLAKASISWPTRAAFNRWTVHVPARPTETRLFRVPRLAHEAIFGGVNAGECSSGGNADTAHMIHPEDYALVGLPGAEAVVAISQDVSTQTLEFGGTATLYRYENLPDTASGMGLLSRFQHQPIARMRDTVLALLELLRIPAVLIEGSDVQVENSGWTPVMRREYLHAAILPGRQTLVGIRPLMYALHEMIDPEMARTAANNSLLGQGIAPGTTRRSTHLIQVDRPTLEALTPESQSRLAAVHLSQLIRTFHGGVFGGDLVLRILRITEQFRETAELAAHLFEHVLQLGERSDLNTPQLFSGMAQLIELAPSVHDSLLPLLIRSLSLPTPNLCAAAARAIGSCARSVSRANQDLVLTALVRANRTQSDPNARAQLVRTHMGVSNLILARDPLPQYSSQNPQNSMNNPRVDCAAAEIGASGAHKPTM